MNFPKVKGSAAAWAAGYAVIGSLWIVFSDQILAQVVEPSVWVRYGSLKGLGFVGVTAVLFIIAMSTRESGSQATGRKLEDRDQKIPRGLIIALSAFALAIISVGALAYVSETEKLTQSETTKMLSIARLKVDDLKRWVSARRTNALVFANFSRSGGNDIRTWVKTRDPAQRETLTKLMKSFAANYGFENVSLVDAGGSPMLSGAQQREALDPEELSALEDARFAPDHMSFVDLHQGADGKFRLGFAVVFPASEGVFSQAGGAIVFTLLAEDYFLPHLAKWPMPSSTGEVILVEQKDASTVAYLSSLKRRSQSPLGSVAPLSSDRLSAKALTGVATTVLSADYAGNPVMAAMLPVPGTPWTVIAKVDKDEAFADIVYATRLLAIMLLAILAAMVAAVSALWRGTQLRIAQSELELRDYLRALARATPGALVSVHMAPNHRIRLAYATKRFEDICGIDPDVLTQNAKPFFERVHQDDIAGIRSELRDSAAQLRKACFEFRMNHPLKGLIWVEARMTPERAPDGGTMWHGFAIDATDRKQKEERLRLADTVYNSADEGILVTDESRKILAVNAAFTAITGFGQEELIGRTPRVMSSGRHDRLFYADLWQSVNVSGTWRGEIWNRRKNGEIYPQWMSVTEVRNEAGEVTNYVSILSDMSRIKQSESRIEHLAHFDALTDLPNRLLLRSRLDHIVTRARGDDALCAVLHLKIDRLETVNDSLGSEAGDDLLIKIAARIKTVLKEGDTLARVGGDEFVILLEDLSDRAEVARIGEALLEALSQPFHLSGGQEAVVRGNIGVALLPDDGDTADLLLKHAQTALNEGKRTGEGRCVYYSTPLTAAAHARLELEANLRRALAEEQFVLHYQPLVRVSDDCVKGVEALLRWPSATGDYVSPAAFIPVAEQTAMIVPLGNWVLRKACSQMRSWLDAGYRLDIMAVNLSTVQFRDASLVDTVAMTLREFDLPGHHLELEITESALAEDAGDAHHIMTRLRELGVRLAIDDFGTGYSSLAYLKRFPINKLKIDRGFVRDLSHSDADRQIATAVIAMARSLGLEALAEGVERPEQLAFLRDRGCDTVQGFLYSQALAPREFETWLEAFESSTRLPRRANAKFV